MPARCTHTSRVAYTDEGGVYARCLTCRMEFLNGHPMGAGTPAGSDPLQDPAPAQLEFPLFPETPKG